MSDKLFSRKTKLYIKKKKKEHLRCNLDRNPSIWPTWWQRQNQPAQHDGALITRNAIYESPKGNFEEIDPRILVCQAKTLGVVEYKRICCRKPSPASVTLLFLIFLGSHISLCAEQTCSILASKIPDSL